MNTPRPPPSPMPPAASGEPDPVMMVSVVPAAEYPAIVVLAVDVMASNRHAPAGIYVPVVDVAVTLLGPIAAFASVAPDAVLHT